MKTRYLVPNWANPSVKAYSTTRLGGHSHVPFDSFNLAMHVEDCDHHVKANRQQLIQELNLPSAPFWLKQVHGCQVASLHARLNSTEKGAVEEEIIADAAITTQKNVVCAIMSADCLPILLCDQQATQVAAIHAGWRGLASGIIFETLKKINFDQHNKILAWLGPAIGPHFFEIDEAVKIALSDLLPLRYRQNCFTRVNSRKYLANLYQIAKHHLHASGVKYIQGGEYCTYTQSDLFFSYRRASKQIGKNEPALTGRMASLIWIA